MIGKEKGKSAGRPAHKPTDKDRKIVSFASAIGLTQDQIGGLIGIHDETLRVYYRDELDFGTASANMKVGQNLFNIATGSTPQAASAAMFWMKTRAGWREVVRQENTGEDGGPIKFEDVTIRLIQPLNRLD